MLVVALLTVSGCAGRNNEPDPLLEKARAVPRSEVEPEPQPIQESPKKPAQKPAARPAAQKPSAKGNGSQPQAGVQKPAPKAEPPKATATDFSAEYKGQFRKGMLELINTARKEAGLNPLAYFAKADSIADFRAADMVKRQYFSHTPPEGPDFRGLLAEAGLFEGGLSGENACCGHSDKPEALCEETHKALINSPGHRANIVDPEFTHVSIGVARGIPQDPNYGATVVQIFLGNPPIMRETAPKAEPPKATATDFSAEFKSQFRQEMLGYINEARKESGVQALEYCTDADPVADARATDMVKRGYFAHETPEGEIITKPLGQAGLYKARFRSCAENICQTSGVDYKNTCKRTHNSLMGSAGHKANILNPGFTHVSIGVSRGHLEDPKTGVTVVQIFLGSPVK